MLDSVMEADVEEKSAVKVPFNLRMDRDLVEYLKEISRIIGKPMTELIEEGTEAWLQGPEVSAELQKRKLEIEQIESKRKKP